MIDQRPLLVVAIGGNALLHRGEAPDVATQRANIARAAGPLAALARSHRLVVTHGNGPQVGLLARQAAALVGSEPVPLDVLGAESAGLIGYLLADGLAAHVDPARVVVVLTRVRVDPGDAAFATPSKPIGPKAEGRRVVASPLPQEIVELGAIRTLVDDGLVVIAGGGGGVPVVAGPDGILVGVEAVVDKDATSALVAVGLGATELLVLTDVDAVHAGWGTEDAVPIHRTTPARLRAETWASGSMGPKVAAVCMFVERTGRVARIGSLDDAAAVLAGRAGTTVEPD